MGMESRFKGSSLWRRSYKIPKTGVETSTIQSRQSHDIRRKDTKKVP